jgi:hypothetical protein
MCRRNWSTDRPLEEALEDHEAVGDDVPIEMRDTSRHVATLAAGH